MGFCFQMGQCIPEMEVKDDNLIQNLELWVRTSAKWDSCFGCRRSSTLLGALRRMTVSAPTMLKCVS